MHSDDQMTPKERLSNFAKGLELDRIPIIPFLGTIGGSMAGMSLQEGRRNSKNEALLQVACYERLGNDLLNIDYGLHGLGIALGSNTNDPYDDIPAISKFAMNQLEDISKLDLDLCRIEKDSHLLRHVEASEILLNRYHDECDLDITIPGPFTAASSLYPIDKLLRSSRKNPIEIHRLLKLCTQGLIIVCEEFAKLGVSFTICDPVASSNIISTQQFKEFVMPYTIELVDKIHDLGTGAGYHICGNTTPLLELMVDTKVDMLSLDSAVDLGFARQKVGERICLVGNVDPVNIIYLGDAQQIELAVKSCCEIGMGSPNGFILATGCDIPSKTALENVDAFMDAGRKYGKMNK